MKIFQQGLKFEQLRKLQALEQEEEEREKMLRREQFDELKEREKVSAGMRGEVADPGSRLHGEGSILDAPAARDEL